MNACVKYQSIIDRREHVDIQKLHATRLSFFSYANCYFALQIQLLIAAFEYGLSPIDDSKKFSIFSPMKDVIFDHLIFGLFTASIDMTF